MAALITKRFRNATGRSIMCAGEESREERSEEKRGEKGGIVSSREDGQERETTVPEGATSEMHYSWSVRRYDMIQYVVRPYPLNALNLRGCREQHPLPNLLKIGPRIFE